MSTFDKASRLLIPFEDLEKASFKKTPSDKIGRRVGNEQDSPLYTTEVPEGGEVHNFSKAPNVPKSGGSNDHEYTVPLGRFFLLTKILFSGSGRMKVELQAETGPATGLYNTIAVAFSSTAKLSDEINLTKTYEVAAGRRVRVIKTNLDNSDQDLYTTIIGVEK